MESDNHDQKQEPEIRPNDFRDWIPLDVELCRLLCRESPPRSYSYWTHLKKEVRSFEIFQYLIPILIVGGLIAYKESWQIALAAAGIVAARYLFTLNRAVSAMRHDTVEYGSIAGDGDPTPYPKQSLLAGTVNVRAMNAVLSSGASVLVVFSKGPLTELLDGGRSAEVLVRIGSRYSLNYVIAYRSFPERVDTT